MLEQVYEANKKAPPQSTTNVNYSVSGDSIRLSNISSFSNAKPTDDSIRVSYVGTIEEEKKTKVTLQFEPWELESAKGCGKRTGMFTKYALQDVSRNKCHFMLAFCSVFVVVLSTLLINTIIEKGPLIFLSLGEKD